MSTHPVYVISGVAGSGKTTLAHAWAPTMGAAIVDLDVVAANVVDTALHEHPEARPWQINAAYRVQRYRCLIDAITSERRSATVMAVAPFTQEIAGEAPWSQFVRDIGGGEWLTVISGVALVAIPILIAVRIPGNAWV